MDGIFGVMFRADTGDVGSGIVYLDSGKLRGGDHGFYYTGTYSVSGNTLSARALIRRFNNHAQNVFGHLNNFELEITGQIQGGDIVGNGRISLAPSRTIDLQMTRLPE